MLSGVVASSCGGDACLRGCVMAAMGLANITNCDGTKTHGSFSKLTFSPNPPTKGALINFAGTGTVTEAVTSAATYDIAVNFGGVSACECDARNGHASSPPHSAAPLVSPLDDSARA